jgi:CIC family chloride channel protein
VTDARGVRAYAQRSRSVILASAVVGVVTGLLVAAADQITVHLLDGMAELPSWAILLAPGVGLVLAAASLRWLAFRAPTSLADTWLRAYHFAEYEQEVRQAPGSVLASILTIGFGGAMGLEGLSLYTGGAVGTLAQHRLGRIFADVDRNLLMTAGAAAGVAAIFKAPATGALFAIEVPYADDFAHRKLLPCLVAAATGYLGFIAVNGTAPLFAAHEPGSFDAVSLIGAIAVGVLAGLGARVFAAGIRAAKRLTIAVPLGARIAVSTVTAAALLLIARATTGHDLTLGPGYAAIQWAARPDRAVPLLLLVLLLRCVATMNTVAGGGAGGLFIPLVVAGAILGRAFGEAVGATHESLFLIVGVAAFLGAGYRVPLAAVMFVAETTGKATFVVPALLAAVASDLVMGDACVTAYQIGRAEST